MRRSYPFYRSPIVRWAFLLSGAFLTYDLSPWAPRAWHNTLSLIWLHQLLPWPVLSGALLIYTLLLLWGSVPAVVTADFLGLFMYLCELIALVATVKPQAFNPWVIVAFALVCVFHLVAGKMAVYQHERS